MSKYNEETQALIKSLLKDYKPSLQHSHISKAETKFANELNGFEYEPNINKIQIGDIVRYVELDNSAISNEFKVTNVYRENGQVHHLKFDHLFLFPSKYLMFIKKPSHEHKPISKSVVNNSGQKIITITKKMPMNLPIRPYEQKKSHKKIVESSDDDYDSDDNSE